jgi:hypothetical protein
VSHYHVHARLFEGTLAAPVRNESHIDQVDDLAEAEQLAKAWVCRSFTVWVYDHGHTAVSPGGCDYRTLLRYSPDGQLVDYRQPAAVTNLAGGRCPVPWPPAGSPGGQRRSGPPHTASQQDEAGNRLEFHLSFDRDQLRPTGWTGH